MKANWKHDFNDYQNHDIASLTLAEALKHGKLMLFVGTGISAKANIPKWFELVNLLNEQTIKKPESITLTTPNDTLIEVVEEIENSFNNTNDYINKVQKVLYANEFPQSKLIDIRLLIAIGALVFGSSRGNVKDIISFNYDDILESYFELHGNSCQAITEMHSVFGESDVRIFHPHGFLPYYSSLEKQKSDFLILSKYSYDKRLGERLNYWKELTRHFLESKIVLFIGLSGDDDILSSIIADVAELLKEKRVTGFWMLGPGASKSDSYFENRNIIPLRFTDFEEYPNFILSVCRKAKLF